MSGRSYCSVVESYECEAPAGFRTGMGGIFSAPGVLKSKLHECAYCGELVCKECSSEMTPPAFFKKQDPVRVCLSHDEKELAEWLGL